MESSFPSLKGVHIWKGGARKREERIGPTYRTFHPFESDRWLNMLSSSKVLKAQFCYFKRSTLQILYSWISLNNLDGKPKLSE
ncbi:S-cell enriched with leucine-rich repeat-containing slrA [Gossypium arboreum]|uniref:S-cell enriched with leucine-rich repeat-containing slrA n=1 Tax=Gossypium arboreum TaxID=29729 RepID=A0A0B0Q0T5_GOSAR|nr:S-cell enriched with leucine-rich repeat-containing slrA [Gossypium arboreum]